MIKIVKITSMGCMSCIIMEDRFNRIAKRNNLEVSQLNADMDDLGSYSIYNEYPSFIVLNQDNEYIDHFVGEFKESELEDLILQYKNE